MDRQMDGRICGRRDISLCVCVYVLTASQGGADRFLTNPSVYFTPSAVAHAIAAGVADAGIGMTTSICSRARRGSQRRRPPRARPRGPPRSLRAAAAAHLRSSALRHCCSSGPSAGSRPPPGRPARTHAHAHARTHAHTHTHAHARTHAHTRTRTQTRTHTHTRAHRRIRTRRQEDA